MTTSHNPQAKGIIERVHQVLGKNSLRTLDITNKQLETTEHHYKVGDMVLLEKPGIIPKLESPCNGPYEILEVYNNGTVRIKVNGTVKERVNLQRLTSFNQRLQ